MAFGEALATAVGSFYEPGSQQAALASSIGGLADVGIGAFQYISANNRANTAAQAQQALIDNQVAMGQAQYADERAIRERVLSRVSQLDGALKETLNNLGARAGVNPGDITQNYDLFRTQVMDDYNKSLDRISSQGYADAIRRGMDSSTQMTDERRALADAAAANIPKLQQSAYDAAIARSTQYADAVNYGRTDTLKEMSDIYGSPIQYETNLMPNNGPTISGAAITNQGTMANNLASAAADSQTYLGDAVGRFTETVAPNFGYAVSGRGSFVDPSAKTIADLESENARLRASVAG